MKHIIIFLLVIISGSIKAQLANASFDDWIIENGCEVPEHWTAKGGWNNQRIFSRKIDRLSNGEFSINVNNSFFYTWR